MAAKGASGEAARPRCHTGGIGLRLACALTLRLAGLALSPVAVAQVTDRRADFCSTGADQAAFRGLLKDAPDAEAAKAFIALVESAESQEVLTEAGFLKP